MNTKNIYLDANFLVYWALPHDSDTEKRARFLLAQILTGGNNIATSCLAIDEMCWWVKTTYNKINKSLLSCADEPIISLLENFIDKIMSRISILQFLDSKAGIKSAMENIRQFRLKPRDAFHLSIMKANEFYSIVTNDEDFEKIKDQAKIEVIF